MMTKYDTDLPKNILLKNIGRLTNQLWKLIPMKENNEDWEKQLNTIIIEISGMSEILKTIPECFQLLNKLEGILLNKGMSFELYRKTVFESISLLQELKKYD